MAEQSVGAKFAQDIAKPVYADVEGAPRKIGEQVRVRQVVDESTSKDFVGLVGVVEYLEYSCGCGQQFPQSPMIGVRFPCRTLEEFWPEELEDVAPEPRGGDQHEQRREEAAGAHPMRAGELSARS